MKRGVPLAAVALALVWSVNVKGEPTTTCLAAALDEYNAALLRLLQDNEPLSVTKQIAQRRLQEAYCLRIARCRMIEPSTQPLEYTATFSACLRDETLEHYGLDSSSD